VSTDQPSGETEAEIGQINSEVVKAIVGAYYTSAVASSDSARKRAEFSYTVSAAIAAALVTAGAFGSLDERSWVVQVLAFLALFAWLCAAGLFVHAVASPVEQPKLDDPVVKGARNFVIAVRNAITKERETVNTRQRRARWCAAFAALITVAALAGALVFESPEQERDGRIVLTAAGVQHVQQACPSESPVVSEGTPTIEGRIDKGSTSDQDAGLRVELDGGVCGAEEADLVLKGGDFESYVLF